MKMKVTIPNTLEIEVRQAVYAKHGGIKVNSDVWQREGMKVAVESMRKEAERAKGEFEIFEEYFGSEFKKLDRIQIKRSIHPLKDLKTKFQSVI